MSSRGERRAKTVSLFSRQLLISYLPFLHTEEGKGGGLGYDRDGLGLATGLYAAPYACTVVDAGDFPAFGDGRSVWS